LPGVAYPGFRDNRSTLNTKTGFKKKTLKQRMAVSREISRADRCRFGLSSQLSTKSSTDMHQTRSITAWLPDNCTRIVDSLQQTNSFQVSNPCRRRAIHATSFVQHTALTGPLHSVPQTTWSVICYHNISQYNETQHTSPWLNVQLIKLVCTSTK